MPLTLPSRKRHLVLVGGGHTHVQVLRAFMMEPPADTQITVVLDQPVAVYSGMVPGFVAGQYAAHELEIDVVPLARRAGARVLLSAATGIDTDKRRIVLADRPPLPYDIASFDIGSTVIGLELPGVREASIATRPISRFVEALGDRLGQGDNSELRRVLVVGGGAGGIELAFSVQQRLTRLDLTPTTRLLHQGERILEGYPSGVVTRVERAAAQRGIDIRCRSRVVRVEDKYGDNLAVLEDDTEESFDLLLWVTGAQGFPLFRDSGLETDDRGFVKTRRTLQLLLHDDLYAVGDCGTIEGFESTPKAGVYAVRQGPPLIENLLSALAGKQPRRRYRPQRDFLTLLNLGDGSAIGAKWGASFEGQWVMRLKDRIDRRFMQRFQALEPNGQLTREFYALPTMDEEEMVCGGCAAKLGQPTLEAALARLAADSDDSAASPDVILGLDKPDDAAAYRTPTGDCVVRSLDFFRAFTDDPFVVGRVAALNAAGDLQAKGIPPRYALAVVTVPETLTRQEAEETLFQVLAGAQATFDNLGIQLLGGHTTTGPVLQVGFSVDGLAARGDELLTLDRLQVASSLVLTKALGTGVVLHADAKGLSAGRWLVAALKSMQLSNGEAAVIARMYGASAATDVTGFGLAGHLAAMLRASGRRAFLDLGALPALPGAVELLSRGERSTFHSENERGRSALSLPQELSSDPRIELLFDPQTAGGLLFGLPSTRAQEVVEALREAGYPDAAAIGLVTAAGDDQPLIRVVDS